VKNVAFWDEELAAINAVLLVLAQLALVARYRTGWLGWWRGCIRKDGAENHENTPNHHHNKERACNQTKVVFKVHAFSLGKEVLFLFPFCLFLGNFSQIHFPNPNILWSNFN
jgi:hypothetical protein